MVTFCYVFQLLIIRRIYKSIPFARRWNPYTIVDLSNIVGVGYKTIDLARGRKRPTEKRCSDCDFLDINLFTSRGDGNRGISNVGSGLFSDIKLYTSGGDGNNSNHNVP